ncbi:3'-5' exonuclease [Bdellovibrio sp. BCCA]|uniref:3'-5' exonuclease n=1 Tax=Bdellovibrio sp. BCCA TaxID=3136281 RepID=UPI0030F2918C
MIKLGSAKAIPWKNLSPDGESVILRRLQDPLFEPPAYYNKEWLDSNAESVAEALILDCETTGTDAFYCEIIELAAKRVLYNKKTGEFLAITGSYQAFQEPKSGHISEEITELTGITIDQVKGKSIDWGAFETLLSPCGVVIAHNAPFDRSFVDVKSTMSREKVWACSIDCIKWKAQGMPSAKLELLSVYHGVFSNAHRAMADVDVLVHILAKSRKGDHSEFETNFHELLERARMPKVRVIAKNSPFDMKNLLKVKGYLWNAEYKYWFKNLPEAELEAEKAFLKDRIYNGADLSVVQRIPRVDVYKTNMSLAG